MRCRAFGLRPVPPVASRPSGFNPSRLRTGSAARSACGFCCMVPATMGKTLACATACCTRLRKSVPSSMLALGRPHVTEGGHQHGAPSGRISTQHQHYVAAGQGEKRSGLSSGNGSLPGSGYMPAQPSCGDTGPALSPFGVGRPMRVLGLS